MSQGYQKKVTSTKAVALDTKADDIAEKVNTINSYKNAHIILMACLGDI